MAGCNFGRADRVASLYLWLLCLAFRPDAFFLEYGTFFFQLHDAVVKFGFFQQVSISGKYRHELGKIHAVVLSMLSSSMRRTAIVPLLI